MPRTATTRLSTRGQIVPTRSVSTTPTPAPVLQGKQTTRSAVFKNTPASPTTTPTTTTNDFSTDILRMINSLPPGTARDQAFSAFQKLSQQSPEDQKRFMDSLMTQAQNATNPQYQQDLTRKNQDYSYEQSNVSRANQFANDNYKRILEQTDTNALRAKAADNKTLAGVLSRVTSDSFVTNVAGSGIVARRAQASREAAAQQAQDRDVATSQFKENTQATLEQYLSGNTAQMDRSKQLQGRDVTDLGQKNLYDTQSLALGLFNNESADTQSQVNAAVGPKAPPAPVSSITPTKTITATSAPGTTGAERINLRRLQRQGNTFQ